MFSSPVRMNAEVAFFAFIIQMTLSSETGTAQLLIQFSDKISFSAVENSHSYCFLGFEDGFPNLYSIFQKISDWLFERFKFYGLVDFLKPADLELRTISFVARTFILYPATFFIFAPLNLERLASARFDRLKC